MSLQGVSKEAESCLALLGRQRWLREFYLAGGTGVALQLGHRLSFDLDLFKPQNFSTRALKSHLETVGRFSVDQESPNTLSGILNHIKISFMAYPYPLLYSTHSYLQVKVADLRDIACMKLDAIGSRGTKRDFVDLYFICQDERESLKKLLGLYEKKFKMGNVFHIMKSLTYFEDADQEEMPRMVKPCRWEAVKRFFEADVKKIVAKGLK